MKIPNTQDYNIKFRPNSYWGPKDLPDHFATRIKGELRKQAIVNELEEGKFVNKNDLSDSLSDEELKQVGSIHPWLMGGEYLPDYYPNEVEIARVTLNSTTYDVISVRAYRVRKRIHYRIVDEYQEDFDVVKPSSNKPLTFKEIIKLIDNATEDGGLVNFYRNLNYSQGAKVEDIYDFANASSVYYEELSSWYDEVNEQWLLEKQKELNDDHEWTGCG